MALLGRAARRIALDDEELGERGIALLAVGELAGQRAHVERALAPGKLARLARGLAGGGCFHHLGGDLARLRGMLLEPLAELLAHHRFDDRADLGRDQLVLGLRGELGIRNLHRQHAGQALAHVVAGQRDLLPLGDAAFVGVFVHRPGERAAEAGEMGAAVALRDVVGEAQHRLVIAVVPLHGDFDGHAVLLAADRHRRAVQHLLVAVEILGEGLDAALVEQLADLGLGGALVAQHDAHARIQEGQLAQPVLERREVEVGLGEDLRRGQEGHLRAALSLRRIADQLEILLGVAVAETHKIFLAAAPDVQVEMLA